MLAYHYSLRGIRRPVSGLGLAGRVPAPVPGLHFGWDPGLVWWAEKKAPQELTHRRLLEGLNLAVNALGETTEELVGQLCGDD